MAEGKAFYVKIDVIGLAEKLDMLRNLSTSVQEFASTGLGQLVQEAQRVVKNETPVDSGKLAKSTAINKRSKYAYEIIQTATAGAGSGGGRRTANYFYGRGVRMGTRGGYMIKPRARAMIYWDDTKKGCIGLTHPIPWVGRPHTAEHPGIKQPYNYVAEATKRLQPKISAFTRTISAGVSQGSYKRFMTKTLK